MVAQPDFYILGLPCTVVGQLIRQSDLNAAGLGLGDGHIQICRGGIAVVAVALDLVPDLVAASIGASGNFGGVGSILAAAVHQRSVSGFACRDQRLCSTVVNQVRSGLGGGECGGSLGNGQGDFIAADLELREALLGGGQIAAEVILAHIKAGIEHLSPIGRAGGQVLGSGNCYYPVTIPSRADCPAGVKSRSELGQIIGQLIIAIGNGCGRRLHVNIGDGGSGDFLIVDYTVRQIDPIAVGILEGKVVLFTQLLEIALIVLNIPVGAAIERGAADALAAMQSNAHIHVAGAGELDRSSRMNIPSCGCVPAQRLAIQVQRKVASCLNMAATKLRFIQQGEGAAPVFIFQGNAQRVLKCGVVGNRAVGGGHAGLSQGAAGAFAVHVGVGMGLDGKGYIGAVGFADLVQLVVFIVPITVIHNIRQLGDGAYTVERAAAESGRTRRQRQAQAVVAIRPMLAEGAALDDQHCALVGFHTVAEFAADLAGALGILDGEGAGLDVQREGVALVGQLTAVQIQSVGTGHLIGSVQAAIAEHGDGGIAAHGCRRCQRCLQGGIVAIANPGLIELGRTAGTVAGILIQNLMLAVEVAVDAVIRTCEIVGVTLDHGYIGQLAVRQAGQIRILHSAVALLEYVATAQQLEGRDGTFSLRKRQAAGNSSEEAADQRNVFVLHIQIADLAVSDLEDVTVGNDACCLAFLHAEPAAAEAMQLAPLAGLQLRPAFISESKAYRFGSAVPDAVDQGKRSTLYKEFTRSILLCEPLSVQIQRHCRGGGDRFGEDVVRQQLYRAAGGAVRSHNGFRQGCIVFRLVALGHGGCHLHAAGLALALCVEVGVLALVVAVDAEAGVAVILVRGTLDHVGVHRCAVRSVQAGIVPLAGSVLVPGERIILFQEGSWSHTVGRDYFPEEATREPDIGRIGNVQFVYPTVSDYSRSCIIRNPKGCYPAALHL